MGANQDNPFAFGVFVSGEQFYDRVEIRADLLRYIRNRQKRDVFDTRLETLTADYRRRHGLGVYTTVVSASKTLLDRGILECESGVYRVADPFFAAYLREAVAALYGINRGPEVLSVPRGAAARDRGLHGVGAF